MTVHVLKSVLKPFEAVWSGAKRYEVRRADRPFTVGDGVILVEFEPSAERLGGWYGGRAVLARIVHLTPPEAFGLPAGLCVFGFEVVQQVYASKRVAREPPPCPPDIPEPFRAAWRAFVVAASPGPAPRTKTPRRGAR